MEELTVAELNPLVHGLKILTDETGPTGAALAKQVEVDEASGKVRVDHDTLKQAAVESFPESVAESFLYASASVVSGGMAVFKDPVKAIPKTTGLTDDPASTEEESGPVVVPWVVISDLVHSLQGAPPDLRSALGLEAASSGEDVSRILRESFPNVPDWMLAGGSAELFVREPAETLPSLAWLASATREGSLPPRPLEYEPSWQAAAGPPQPGGDAFQAAMDVVRGKWNGLGGHWWGWPFGWQVGISAPAARNLAYVLIGLDGGKRLSEAIFQAFRAAGASAGLRALCLTWLAAAMLYAAVLGGNILAVVNSKGVRIQGNWPVVGGPGAFIWAIKG